MPVDPWTTFLTKVFNGTSEVNLTTTKQTYSFDFTMENSTYDNSRVEFSVGSSTGIVYIDNVALFEVEATSSSVPLRNNTVKRMTFLKSGSMVNVSLDKTSNASLNVYDLKGNVVLSSGFTIGNCGFSTAGMSMGYYVVKAHDGKTIHRAGFLVSGR